MYVNSGGPGASDCEDTDDDDDENPTVGIREEHCANDQPVASSLRASLEHLLVENQVRCFLSSASDVHSYLIHRLCGGVVRLSFCETTAI